MTKFTISALVNGVALDWTGDQFHENATPWHFETLTEAQRHLRSMSAEFLREAGFQCDAAVISIEQWGEDEHGDPTMWVVEQKSVSPRLDLDPPALEEGRGIVRIDGMPVCDLDHDNYPPEIPAILHGAYNQLCDDHPAFKIETSSRRYPGEAGLEDVRTPWETVERVIGERAAQRYCAALQSLHEDEILRRQADADADTQFRVVAD